MSKLIYPEIGKVYNVFDNGVISDTRRFQVVVNDISTIEESPFMTLLYDEMKYNGLYKSFTNATDTPVVYATSLENKYMRAIHLAYVPCIDNNWFGIGSNWDGILDVDGSLTKRMKEEYEHK